MTQEPDGGLIDEAACFMELLRDMGVYAWVDAASKELVFSPRSKMTGDMVVEAHRLRNCLARLIGPDVRVTTNPYSVSWN